MISDFSLFESYERQSNDPCHVSNAISSFECNVTKRDDAQTPYEVDFVEAAITIKLLERYDVTNDGGIRIINRRNEQKPGSRVPWNFSSDRPRNPTIKARLGRFEIARWRAMIRNRESYRVSRWTDDWRIVYSFIYVEKLVRFFGRS